MKTMLIDVFKTFKRYSWPISLLKPLFFVLVVLMPMSLLSFGFEAHRQINKNAVFILPGDMLLFFKTHIDFIVAESITPDKLSRVIEDEAANHYIDTEFYSENFPDSVPLTYTKAFNKYGAENMQKHGILPWHIINMYYRLIKAFEQNDNYQILINASRLGHYVGDACTPLHSSIFYNGKTQAQKGIHNLWETRIPSLFMEEYSFVSGKAGYIENPYQYVFEMIKETHLKVDSIFTAFNQLTDSISLSEVLSPDVVSGNNTLNFSREFCYLYQRKLNSMIERQIRNAIKATGSLWLTAWVNAGQPGLDSQLSRKDRKKMKSEKKKLQEIIITPLPIGDRE